MIAVKKILEERRAPIVERMHELVRHAGRYGRPLNSDERLEFERLDEVQSRIKRECDYIACGENAYRFGSTARDPDETGLRAWLLAPTGQLRRPRIMAAKRAGYDLDSRQIELKLCRSVAAPRTVADARRRNRIIAQARAQTTVSDTAGGYTVGDELMAAIDVALLESSPMRRLATVYTTTTGGTLYVPVVDDTANTGEIVDETSPASGQDVAFGQQALGAYRFSSKLILCSLEYLQDAAVSIPQLLGQILGRRIGASQNAKYTIGTGAGEPTGIVTAAVDSGVTTASPTAFTVGELFSLKHAVDPHYREHPGTGWMCDDTTLRQLKLMVDASGHPIWCPSLAPGEPDCLDGQAVYVNTDMASGTGTKALIYGDLAKYAVREVLGVDLVRMDQRYGEFGQAAFVAWHRSDGHLINAGAGPVKYLTMA